VEVLLGARAIEANIRIAAYLDDVDLELDAARR